MPPKRILIVDDSLELGRVLRTALEVLDAALSVRIVPSAEEALLELTSRPVDLLVADVRLPGRMSGLDLIRRMDAPRAAGMKVIVITGWSESNIEDQARSLKADAFLRKPIQMGEFLDIVKDLLALGGPADPGAEQQPVTRPPVHQTGMLGRTGGLRMGTGMLRPAPVDPAADLSSTLSRLRVELGAQAVVLFNPHGRIAALAGELPQENFESRWSSLVMSMAGNSEAFLRSINGPAAALAFRGELYDLLLAPVGGYALVLVLRGDRSMLRLPLAVEETLFAQLELAGLLSSIGVPVQPPPDAFSEAPAAPVAEAEPPAQPEPEPAPVPAPEPEPNPEDVTELDALFAQKDALIAQDADQFWESASSDQPTESNEPGVLTYEQARRLGLAPEDKDTFAPV